MQQQHIISLKTGILVKSLHLHIRYSSGWPLFSKVKNIKIYGLHIVSIDEKKIL